ncbi:ornithine cyclodeaminase [Jannaschia sp. Os4]|uniref:ornithine cyclodeaminase n=1 Tax=Jannaschia sp. Os4 TaxID=2807617 RepID=UPI00193975D2|nr:ornithine cyclodeaminase [Jannaschia sp. Os4]MBM2576277.1 ornithine cyclodeaminase [Jannaschia sp. Os4]
MNAQTPAPGPLSLVPFVSVDDMMRLIARIGLRPALRELADYVERDFRRWDDFDKTPRVAAHSPGGVIELMPTSDGETYAFKYVNGHPRNGRTGHQTVTAFGVLSDVATGYPLLVSEMTILTALRTAATSAMAARHLAPKGARTMAMIGNGAQCAFQALAFAEVAGITSVRLFDVDAAATRAAARHLRDAGLDVAECTTPEAAIEGARIVTTCTADKRNATILTDNMVGPGVHLNAIGGDCPGKTELHRDVVARASMFVEYPPQTRIEGELQQMPEDHPFTELHRVVRGEAPGRTSDDQITLFDSVGFAVEDFSALCWVRDKVGGDAPALDLLADPDDPRDLFGMLRRGGVAV